MALTAPTNKLETQTVSSSFDQLLYLDNAAGLVEATLKVVSTETGKSAVQLDDERLLVQGVDTSNAAAFEVRNTGGTSVFKVNASTPSAVLTGSGTKLYFYDAGGEYISADASGVLSIVGGSEIDLTATAIDINGTVDISGTLALNDDITVAAGKKIYFDSTDTYIYSNADDPEDLVIGADADIILEPDANVGIGTTSPDAKLHVTAADNDTIATDALSSAEIQVSNTSSTTNSFASVKIKANNGDVSLDAVYKSANTADFVIRTENSGSLEERMRILADGKCGIGTAAPGTALEVNTSATGVLDILTLENTNTGDGTAAILFQSNRGSIPHEARINVDPNADTAGSEMQFSTDNTSGVLTQRMVIDKAGKVGIGTATPSNNLHVVGTTFCAGGVMVSSAVESTKISEGESGTSSTTLYIGDETIDTTDPSDINLKANIVDSSFDCLDMLNKFNFKDFNWNAERIAAGKTDEKQFGLIAQDVEKIVSNLVVVADSHKIIQYNKFMPYLMKAIQELSAEIDKLKGN